MTTVLIVDDHAVVRAGLRLLVDNADGLETVGEAGTADEAVAKVKTLAPDVTLLDVVMPDGDGIEALPAILSVHPEGKVLILSMEDNPGYVRKALNAGASGYVLKEAVDTEVVRAIREVAAGRRYLQPELGIRLVDSDEPEARKPEKGQLSQREREVLRLIALGHTNPEIAERLVISVRTAETHRANIMQKLQVRTRADIVSYAMTEGILRPS
jgi:two-component system, NarL family, response regulator NreC